MREPTREQLESFVGKVISERPYVKLLSAPTWYEEECVVGVPLGEWRALAQVEQTVAVIAVKVKVVFTM